MKQPTRDDKAFEQLRQLPPELSRDQVQSIIELLPNLPPPSSGWFSSFSLNSILMSTIIISTLTVLSFFFITTKDTNVLTENQNYPVEDSFFDKTVTQLVSNDVFAFETNLKEEVAAPNKRMETTTDKKQLTDIQIIKKEDTAITSLPETVIAPENVLFNLNDTTPVNKLETSEKLIDNQLLLAQNDVSLLEDSSNSIADISMGKRGDLFPTKEQKKVQSGWGASMCNLQFKFDQKLNVFKTRLLRHLERDGLISSTKRRMRCYYTNEAIVINNQLLNATLEQKYRDFFADYQLEPCQQRIIETTTDYIAVGDMSDKGFRGSIKGKVDIDKLHLIPYSPLLRTIESSSTQKATRSIGAFHTLIVDGLAVVYLTDKDQDRARLEVTGMPIEDVVTEVKSGVLTVTTRGQHSGESIKVYVSSEQLKEISVGGSSELLPEATVKANKLSVKVLDNGYAWVKVAVNELTVIMQGGDLNIDGSANTRLLLDKDPEHRGTLQEADLEIGNRMTQGDRFKSCYEFLEMTKQDMQGLEIELRDHIIQRGASIGAIDFPAQLVIEDGDIVINGYVLDKGCSDSFFKIFKKYSIRSCEDRLIVVGRKSLAVGDIKEEGFRGMLLGKGIEMSSRYGKIKIKQNRTFRMLNLVGWGTEFNWKD